MINFVFILLIYGDYCFTETNGKSCNKKFVGVVDGGSTNTRLHIFEFQVANFKELINDHRFTSEIPISIFVKTRSDWSLLRIMLNNLTRKAETVVPCECLALTPIHVQITASVAQLVETMRSRILDLIREFYLKSTYKFQNGFVDSLQPKEQGIFAWISVNYLYKILGTNKNTIGMLEMGDGTTQIAVETRNKALLHKAVKMKLFGKEYNIYSVGFYFLGANDIRARFVNAVLCKDTCCRNKVLPSGCIHEDVRVHLKVYNCNISISGEPNLNDTRQVTCYFRADEIVKREVYLPDLKHKEFVAISSYYDIINYAMKKQEDLFEINFEDVFKCSIKACKNEVLKSEKNFDGQLLCLDLSFMTALFFEKYKFHYNHKIFVAKRINGTNVSWALGYAISTL